MSVYPWEIALAPEHAADPGSTRNHLAVEVVSVTTIGNRVRVGLAAPQPLTAELSDAAVRELELRPGIARRRVVEGGGDAAAAADHRPPGAVRYRLAAMTRVAVVGHVEWIEFARVPHLPAPGDIVHATEAWEEAGGGGAVAAVQLAKLGGGADFFTALGDDERARRSAERLAAHGVRVHAAPRAGAAAARLHAHRRRRRAHDHRDRRADRPARRRPAPVGAAGRDRRRLLHRRRPRRAAGRAAGGRARRHAARRRDAARGGRPARRARAQRRRRRRAARPGAAGPAARATS